MPSLVSHVDGGRLTIRAGGGAIALFGLPFLAAGLFVLLGALDVIPVRHTGTMTMPVAIVFGGVFALVGAGFVAGCSVTTLDIAQQAVTKQWRLLVPLRTATYQLGDYHTVTIRFVRGDSEAADQYPIGLKPAAGLDLVLARPATYAQARVLAATVARHVDFEIEDDTTDHPQHLSASDAELSLAQRTRAASETVPPAPAAMRSEVATQSGELRLSIPNPPLNPLVLVAMELPAVVAIVLLFWLLPLSLLQHRPDPGQMIFFTVLLIGFVILPSIGTVSAILKAQLGRTIVTVSRAGIHVDARRVLLPGVRNIATLDANDILDVDFSTKDSILEASRRAAEARAATMRDGASTAGDVAVERVFGVLGMFVKGQGLIVKTRTGVTKFGEGLADDEIRYLHALVQRALVQAA
jgi:hypothetical protein